MAKENQDIFVEAPQVICLPAAEFSLLFFLPYKTVSLVLVPMPKEEVEDLVVEESSMKRARSFTAMCLVASISQSISTTDRLLIILKLLRHVGTDLQFAQTEHEIRGYVQAKVENARRE